MKDKKIRTIVCGSTFGQFYLEALTSLPEHFTIVGLLAQGSERSKKCADYYNIPLLTSINDIPQDVDLACVVLRSGVMGGKGTNYSLEFLNKGIHVIQEHPVHHDDISTCLRAAQKNKVHFITGNLYIKLPAVKRFVECCTVMFKEQKALYIDVAMATQVSFPLIHILLEALPTLRPFKINHVIKDEGPFQIVTGQIGKIPLTIRAHNEVNPEDPDNHLHLLHSINVGFSGGCLALTDTHGPVVWRSKLHIPKNKILAQMTDQDFASLNHSSTIILGPTQPPTYKNILSKQWVRAIAKDLSMMNEFINNKTKIAKRAQQELLCAQQWHQLTNALGYPELKENAKFNPVDVNKLHQQIAKIPLEPEEEGCNNTNYTNKSVFDCNHVAEEELFNVSASTITNYINTMNKAATLSMLKALQDQGALNSKSKNYTEQEILKDSKAYEKHYHVISRWIKTMSKQGLVTEKEGKFTVKDILTKETVDGHWDKVKKVWNVKLGNILSLEYIKDNADHLPDLMTDRKKAALLLFPQGKMDIANALYKETITARYLNKSVAEAVMRIAAEKMKNSSLQKTTLNIVEIGAGTGATSEIVLPQLSENFSSHLHLNYLFSDVSSFFLGAAETKFKKYPWVNFKVIDIDKDFEEQSLIPQSVDIIIAAGVLNNAYNTNEVIQKINKTLVSGGYMLITEPIQESVEILISQAFMMTPPVDDRSKTSSTFMSKEQWMKVFDQIKAKKVVALPSEDHTLAPMGQRLFIVKKTNDVKM